ncbi:caspase family protein [Zwartia sp.]|uniref:caspase family protein n=1 Tax=Zwartia sp. TaxID=2978004 RepID=UPI0027258676|nr:caspase family protein [Zwartia sp.]MDO9025183.1 caspase family protein [Zwartia sp.]
MSTRRTFLKGMASLAPAVSFSDLFAAQNSSAYQALVIGNSQYSDMPLGNPVNDATAVSTLLKTAGFVTDTQLNTSRTNLITAMERFTKVIKQSQTRVVVFYYAGHGAQLDWRNYLVPVDAVVTKRTDMQSRCVDLNNLLGQLSQIKDKTFIIILDACRDDPFGNRYRLDNKGLSQFDAPVGSLLAYSTSPGKVASDGSGANGLYTENLVRELSIPNVRVEDALKRVRLNVRLASNGEQIPWETTSLESDVYLFASANKKQSAAELERLIQEEIKDWAKVKDSKVQSDWVAYLRKYPNGRFSEVAHQRLKNLISVEASQSTPSATLSTGSASSKNKKELAGKIKPYAPPSTGAAVRLGPGLSVPNLWKPSENPYSVGRYDLGRIYTVGDQTKNRISDLLSGIQTEIRVATVTRVDTEADLVEINNGLILLDLMGNAMSVRGTKFETPLAFTPTEYQLGKKWTASNTRTVNGNKSFVTFDIRIAAVEKVRVPAGEFDAFRIEINGWNLTNDVQLKETYWQVPGLNFPVKREVLRRARNGQIVFSERLELMELYQQKTLLDLSI